MKIYVKISIVTFGRLKLGRQMTVIEDCSQ